MALETEVAAVATAVASPGMDVTTPLQAIVDASVGGGGGSDPVLITQEDYDLLSPPDPDTLYAIYPSAAVTSADVAAAIVAAAGAYAGINNQTGTTYTIVLADDGKLVTLTNAAAVTVTLPQDSAVAIPVGHRIDFAGRGAGLVTFVAGTGATVAATPSLVTRAQNSGATATKIAANTWWIVGDLA